MRPVGQRIDILEASEEVGLLDDQRRDVLAFIGRQRLHRDDASGAAPDFLDSHSLVAGRGPGHLPVAWVDARRHQHAHRLRLSIRSYSH